MNDQNTNLEKYKLKNVLREGWKRLPLIEDIESVADHSWSLSILVLEFTPKEFDLSKCLAMAVLHDVPEVLVGDITPHDGIDKAEKHRREEQASHSLLPTHLQEIWKEYAEALTPESKWVHLLDKVEMAIQALLYKKQYGANTDEFLISTRQTLSKYQVHSQLPQSLQYLLIQIGVIPFSSTKID